MDGPLAARFLRPEATEAQMTKRATDVIGLPVVSTDTGKKLGKVVDLLLDENERN